MLMSTCLFCWLNIVTSQLGTIFAGPHTGYWRVLQCSTPGLVRLDLVSVSFYNQLYREESTQAWSDSPTHSPCVQNCQFKTQNENLNINDCDEDNVTEGALN